VIGFTLRRPKSGHKRGRGLSVSAAICLAGNEFDDETTVPDLLASFWTLQEVARAQAESVICGSIIS
jgi:hypothetical protein